MRSKQSVLFCASEVSPFAKTGGLADVAYGLPRALKEQCNIDIILPLYNSIDRDKFSILKLDQDFTVKMGETEYFIEMYGCSYEGLNYKFIYTPILCDTHTFYGTHALEYVENLQRFGVFNYAIVSLLKKDTYDIVHLNDWHCALVPLLLKDQNISSVKSVFTIHNLAYQGVFDKRGLVDLGIDKKYFTMESIEFYDQINFMKAGIAYADKVTTVSPNYAKEILTPEFGCGLENFLKVHSDKLVGILNGIDQEYYTASVSKQKSKKDYLKRINFTGVEKPLFSFIGRLTWQKGVDILIEVLDEIAKLECNIVVIGEGETQYHNALIEISNKYDNIHVYFGYNEELSIEMYKASEFLLMPSLFEPCGLAQMISMNYGGIPIVHDVGGLHDSVQHYVNSTKKKNRGLGIVFQEATKEAFYKAVKKAMVLFANKRQYRMISNSNENCNFSWESSAKVYIELYKNL